jgi:hypothetical protein
MQNAPRIVSIVLALDHFGVESIAPNNTQVCGFLVVP